MDDGQHEIASGADVADALVRLAACDARLGRLAGRHGPPPLRRRPGGLEGLAWIITGQLISAAAAAQIWARVRPVLADASAAHVASLQPQALRDAGLTGAKTAAIIAAGDAVLAGRFSFELLAELPDESAERELCRLTGIGPWTAHVYLLSCLGRPDIWPAGDLALRHAVRDLTGLDRLPGPDEMRAVAEPWRPWRAVAARLLWMAYAEGRSRTPPVS